MSGLPCSDLLLFGQGTWKSMALGFMMQFLIVFSLHFLSGFGSIHTVMLSDK